MNRSADFLLSELSYQIRGCFFDVYNKYGFGLKETIYQNALCEIFNKKNIPYQQHKRIKIFSIDTGKILGTYIPDFIINNLIIIEIKSTNYTIENDIQQIRSYLKASIYELGFLVNFGNSKILIKRIIYTNNRKYFISLLNNQWSV